MMNFLMSFIKENATLPEEIIEINSVNLLISILESILIKMSKLYESKKEEEKNNNKNEVKYKRKELLENSHMLTNKNVYSFTIDMKKYFMNLFFNDIKFSLANRIHKFFKFLELKMILKIKIFLNFMKKCRFIQKLK